LYRKDFHQELVAPAGYAALAPDAFLGRMALQQTDSEAAQPGEIVGDAPLPHSAANTMRRRK
jgi:hypothetical protein